MASFNTESNLPLNTKIFLEGPAGAGKTTAVVGFLIDLLDSGIPGGSILLLVPQRTLAGPYYAALHQPGVPSGGEVTVLTVGGLAQRMIELFWPLVAEPAGFARPDELPTFLTLETAQYYMAHLVRPRLEQEGLFDSVTIDRNRLYSQILDNLNKAAVVGFPHTEIGERLKSAWVGEPAQLNVYEDVQSCVDAFRQYCLAHNLLDFSLQIEIFWKYLWPSVECRQYLLRTYRHLIFDNLEEDTPVAHNLMREWLPDLDSVLFVYDWDAGYRRFLGADPESAADLKNLCDLSLTFAESLIQEPPMAALEQSLSTALRPSVSRRPTGDSQQPVAKVEYEYNRYYPQMLDWVAERIAGLVHDEGVLPGEIVVLAPFLSDALRFSLSHRMQAFNVPARAHRPSRSLREEPATQCLLTLAELAHPAWGLIPSRFDIAYALVQSIASLDLVRAQLLTEIVYRVREGVPTLSSFDQIAPEVQERITYRLGERYEQLRSWLETARLSEAEFDHFLSRLFGEVLSQPGFGFHEDYSAGEITANLIESVKKFRWAVGSTLQEEGIPLGQEYLTMVRDGVIAAQYIRSWRAQAGQAVLLAPAYTFLMSNRPVQVQFWLDVGSRGWAERLYQPLTHPYVLSRGWSSGRLWTDLDEVKAGEDGLYRLVIGLLRRCRGKVYLGLSELNEQGYEQRGPLLHAFQRLLRETHETS